MSSINWSSSTTCPCFDINTALSKDVGSSYIESHKCLWEPAVISVNNNSSYYPINNSGIFGCGCGSYGTCGWSFSDYVNDANEVSLWDSIMGGFKQQAFTDPMGFIGTGLQLAGTGASLFGNLATAGGGLFDSLTSMFNSSNC